MEICSACAEECEYLEMLEFENKISQVCSICYAEITANIIAAEDWQATQAELRQWCIKGS